MSSYKRNSQFLDKLRHVLRAQMRDAIVLFQEAKGALFLFLALVAGSSLLFFFFYIDPETGKPITFARALFSAFALLFFESTLNFPPHPVLQILYFILPIFGLIAVVNGIISFGVALTNKQERGQKWQIAMASTYSGHVIVCGTGKVGYRVVMELLKFEREVVAIELDPQCPFIEKLKMLGVPVIIADARQPENLIKASVKQADAVIPCTDDELANLDIALDARDLNPGAKIVMRMFDPDLAQRIERGFGIHTAFSTSALAAPIFAAAAMRLKVQASFYIDNELLNISEMLIEPGSPVEGWSIQRLERELELTVVSYTEGKTTHLHPGSDLSLNAGGKISALASIETLNRLAGMARQKPAKK